MQEAVENAFDAVEAEHDVHVRRKRGRTTDGEISTAEAIAIVAKAYTGGPVESEDVPARWSDA